MKKIRDEYKAIGDRVLKHIKNKVSVPSEQFEPLPIKEQPINFGTKEPYTSLNAIHLARRRFIAPWYLTPRQVKQMGGWIRPNERGVKLLRYGVHLQEPAHEIDGDPDADRFVRHYEVFNSSQIVGIEFPELIPPVPTNKDRYIELAEDTVNGMPNPPVISKGRYMRAYYCFSEDRIEIPSPDYYNSISRYYEVLFHELIHATGHKHRLNRESLLRNRKNLTLFLVEEITAELGSAFLSYEAGVVTNDHQSVAEYIRLWLEQDEINDKMKLFTWASIQAAEACDYILGRWEKPDEE